MSGPYNQIYWEWLVTQVMDIREQNPRLTHWKMLKRLHNTEFVWIAGNDENRSIDGRNLRTDFILLHELPDEPFWRSLGCSLLEMFIAFSKRAGYSTDTPPNNWFWEFMQNLGLSHFTDAVFDREPNCEDKIEAITHRFIWRTYDAYNTDGLFPVRHPKEDQRKIELWYQLCAYLADTGRL